MLCDDTHDTTYITIHDTIHTVLHDTINTFIHDTLLNQITDTLYHIINDTIIIWVHDTITTHPQQPLNNVLEPIIIHDTIYVHDTTWIVTRDTINRTLRDTLWIDVRDTLWLTLHDTTFLTLHDTIFIDDGVAIRPLQETPFIVHSRDGRIEISNAEGLNLQVYDVYGRCILIRRKLTKEYTIDGLASGVYLVRIGNYPARKVVLLK